MDTPNSQVSSARKRAERSINKAESKLVEVVRRQRVIRAHYNALQLRMTILERQLDKLKR